MTKATAIKSALTAAQRTYLTTRLNEIAEQKRKAKQIELFGVERNWYNDSFRPTAAQIVEAIKKGKATLKKGCEERKGSLDIDTLDWAENEVTMKEYRTNKKAYEKFDTDLAKQQQKIMDGVMLGTADDAMTALENFAK